MNEPHFCSFPQGRHHGDHWQCPVCGQEYSYYGATPPHGPFEGSNGNSWLKSRHQIQKTPPWWRRGPLAAKRRRH
jgi:hypothetical protein